MHTNSAPEAVDRINGLLKEPFVREAWVKRRVGHQDAYERYGSSVVSRVTTLDILFEEQVLLDAERLGLVGLDHRLLRYIDYGFNYSRALAEICIEDRRVRGWYPDIDVY